MWWSGIFIALAHTLTVLAHPNITEKLHRLPWRSQNKAKIWSIKLCMLKTSDGIILNFETPYLFMYLSIYLRSVPLWISPSIYLSISEACLHPPAEEEGPRAHLVVGQRAGIRSRNTSSKVHSFIHALFIKSFHLMIYLCIPSFIHAFLHSFIQRFIYSFFHVCIYSAHSCIHAFN